MGIRAAGVARDKGRAYSILRHRRNYGTGDLVCDGLGLWYTN